MISQLEERNTLSHGKPPTSEVDEISDAGESSDLGEDPFEEQVQIFKLLADKTRLQILFHLSQHEELHVRALCDILGQSQPAVSHHLALLRGKGLIRPRREGKHNFYRLMPKRFQHVVEMFFSVMPKSAREMEHQGQATPGQPVSFTPASDLVEVGA